MSALHGTVKVGPLTHFFFFEAAKEVSDPCLLKFGAQFLLDGKDKSNGNLPFNFYMAMNIIKGKCEGPYF